MTRRRPLPVVLLLLLSLVPMLLLAPRPAVAAGDPEDHGRLLLLLDSSGSMKEPAAGGATKIVAARSALDEVVGGLPADTDVGLRVFGATVFSRGRPGACTDSQLIVRPGTGNRPALTRAIASYKPYGETPIAYALRQAAGDLGSEGNRSIVLVSDGEATCAPNPCRVAGRIAASGIDLRIDVVGLDVSGAARRQLRCIAEAGNGTYYDASSAHDIASSIKRVASRAARPFTVSGRPITGGTDRRHPTPIAIGDWSDTLAGGQPGTPRYYVFDRRTSGTTLRVSVVTPGDKHEWDGVRVDVTRTDRSTAPCDAAVDWRTSQAVIGDEVIAGPRFDCDRPGRYLIAVSRYLSAPDPVPIGIRVAEEPAGRSPAQADVGTGGRYLTPRVSGPSRSVTAGSSFNDATVLGTGRWRSTIVPGEAQMYRVPLDVGQGLRVRVRFPAGRAERQVQLQPGVGSSVSLRLYNPMRGALVEATGAHSVGTTAGELSDAVARVTRGAANTGSLDFSLVGSYYVSLVAQPRDVSPELPYVLDVEVTGSRQPRATYADGRTWSVDASVAQAAAGTTGGTTSDATGGVTGGVTGGSSPTASPTPSATAQAGADDATSHLSTSGTVGTTVKVAAAGALVLLAAVCGGLGLLLLRRSRAR